MNAYPGGGTEDLEILRISGEVEQEQVRALAARRAARDDAAVRSALAAMVDAARTGGANLVPPMLAAARAEATLGEICGALRTEWGSYTEPPRF